MKQLLVFIGPTSTGKTDLALVLAKRFNGELVACDSRQVYRGLDIGTGKLPSAECKAQSVKLRQENGFWEINGIRIWMYDVADPKKQYTVYDYVRDANLVIDGIIQRGKLPIIVGGAGLYLRALIDGLPNLAIPVDKDLRKKLEKLSLEELQEELQKISPAKWRSLNESDKQNPRRLIRAIELTRAVDINTTAVGLLSMVKLKTDILKIGLTAPREILYQRIDKRVTDRINQGMTLEAENLYKGGLSLERMRQLGLEYRVLADYLEGKINSKEELIKILQWKIHGYARRQLTWFKKPACRQAGKKDVSWFDITEKHYIEKVASLCTKWYHGKESAHLEADSLNQQTEKSLNKP